MRRHLHKKRNYMEIPFDFVQPQSMAKTPNEISPLP